MLPEIVDNALDSLARRPSRVVQNFSEAARFIVGNAKARRARRFTFSWQKKRSSAHRDEARNAHYRALLSRQRGFELSRETARAFYSAPYPDARKALWFTPLQLVTELKSPSPLRAGPHARGP